MNSLQKNRILIWLVIILAATNLSTIGSFYYHRISELKTAKQADEDQTTIPGEQRARFFGDELKLTDEQLEQFRTVNRNFNRTARSIEEKLAELRQGMIEELGRTNPDTVWLDSIATEIGENHRELKKVTTTLYLNMNHICNADQQTRLHEIFQSMLNKDSQVNLPQPGHRRGRGWNR